MSIRYSVAFFLSGVFLLTVLPIGILFTFFTLAAFCWRWGYIQGQFLEGDLCPGVVVSESPLLIAVSTDLTTGRGVNSYPAIRVVKENLSHICGVKPRVGARVATVSLYHFWSMIVFRIPDRFRTFSPLPVEHATDDVEAALDALERIGPADWHQLKVGLRSVPRPFRPGLYRIWVLRKKAERRSAR